MVQLAQTKLQKCILVTATVIILLMMLFPPFHAHFTEGDIATGYGGFSWDTINPRNSNVYVALLLTQFVGVCIVTLSALAAAAPPRR
jgi:hypothetical protein